jgi:hypothetical protein
MVEGEYSVGRTDRTRRVRTRKDGAGLAVGAAAPAQDEELRGS